MINDALHIKTVGLDREQHRTLKLNVEHREPTLAANLHAIFLATVEFADACRDLPIVWINAGQGPDGQPAIAPVALLGMKAGQNLCIQPDGRWRTRYLPVMIRMYPFGMVRVGENQLVLCVDESWGGLNRTTGNALFEPSGEPSEFTRGIQKQLEEYEMEVERTRLVGAKLKELGLLRDMRFDATTPDGTKVGIDGFMTVDDDKLRGLKDADVLELNRIGVLGLIHAHQISLGNTAKLVEWMLEAPPAAAAS
ncbi:MAG: SapC family protein [Aquabacterium sp.]